jgi:serine/threonine protein kinase/WD40 repeat protein
MSASNGGGSRERELFLDALQIEDREARRVWLRRECGEDVRLLGSVESLLANHVEDGFLESPVVDAEGVRQRVAAGGAASFGPGMVVGRYRLDRVIGEGGCGVVFQAEQIEPVRREVALKLLKPGMDSEAILARFGLERQALAMMDHPNIARVLDAGATEAGYPYFVMELVRGRRITEHCDHERLTVAERVELFMQVCRAVEHAHQKGIIHRDLKPSNILVAETGGKAVPKVIDFGVAKLIQGTSGASDLTMMGGGLIGTPAYMSPEQLGHGDGVVDTRSDVYSLGVLLFEMLCGSTPFSADGRVASVRQGLDGSSGGVLAERPSSRLAGLEKGLLVERARERGVDGAGLVRLVRGDLDCIVLKALEPERDRRYATAGELVEDLGRHLSNETIRARPASALDQGRRWVRRHRVAFSATVLAGLVAVTGLCLLVWQFVEKGVALERAETSEGQERYLRLRLQEANSDEVRLRQLAESRGLQAREQAYAADMNLAQQALAVNNLGRARALLDRHRPSLENEDLRGWEWRYLWQFCQSDALYTLCHRPDEVALLVASPDARWLVVGEGRGNLTLWNLETRAIDSRLLVPPGPVRAAFSGDSRLLAYADRDRVRVKAMIGGEASRELACPGVCVALKFDAEGRRLLVLGMDGRVVIHDLVDGTSTREVKLEGRAGFILAADVTADLEKVVYSDPRGRLLGYRTTDGKELFSVRMRTSEVRALTFSPDGKVVAVGGGLMDPDIWILNAQDGSEVRRLTGHNGWIGSLAFWPDGKRLASASADQTIRIWDLEEPGRVEVLRGHRLEVWSLALTGGGGLLFSGSKDGSVYAWDAKGRSVGTWPVALPGQVRDWWFGGDSGELVTVGENGEVVRWSLGTNVAGLRRVDGSAGGVTPAEDSARRLAWRSFELGPDGAVRARAGAGSGPRAGWRLGGPDEWVMSPDGVHLASPNRTGVTRLRGVRSEGGEVELRGFLLGTHGVAFSPDSHRLAVGSNGSEAVKLFDVSSHQELLTLGAKTTFVRWLAFSPDHRWLAASGRDGQVYLWRAPGFDEIAAREMEAR